MAWPLIKWLCIPLLVVAVLFGPGITFPRVMIFLALVAAGVWWETTGKVEAKETFGASPTPGRRKDESRQEGPWTSNRKFRYPPFYGHEQRPRAQFDAEEQRFIEAFWLPKLWYPACDNAGLVKIIPGEGEQPEQRIYPQLNSVGVKSDGVVCSISPGSSGFTPGEIEAKKAALVMHIGGGMSDIVTETDRRFCRFFLRSRSPLSGTISADDLFGAAPVRKREVTTDDFLDAMGEDDD